MKKYLVDDEQADCNKEDYKQSHQCRLKRFLPRWEGNFL